MKQDFSKSTNSAIFAHPNARSRAEAHLYDALGATPRAQQKRNNYGPQQDHIYKRSTRQQPQEH